MIIIIVLINIERMLKCDIMSKEIFIEELSRFNVIWIDFN